MDPSDIIFIVSSTGELISCGVYCQPLFDVEKCMQICTLAKTPQAKMKMKFGVEANTCSLLRAPMGCAGDH